VPGLRGAPKSRPCLNMAQSGSFSKEEDKAKKTLEPDCQLGNWLVMPC
jgi:hypothetical protein